MTRKSVSSSSNLTSLYAIHLVSSLTTHAEISSIVACHGLSMPLLITSYARSTNPGVTHSSTITVGISYDP